MKSDKPDNEKEYWFSGIDSLGMNPKKTNDLNDSKEMSDLVENVKQTKFQEYKTALYRVAFIQNIPVLRRRTLHHRRLR
jgi:hypothetical protein